MARGRRPKPSGMRVFEGNRSKEPLNDREPMPPAGVPECPEHLGEDAKAEWYRTVKVLKDMGLLSLADRSALAAYCAAYGRWIWAEAEVLRTGAVVFTEKGFPMKNPALCISDQAVETMRKFMIEFGLTPAARSKIKVPQKGKAADELEGFLEATG